MSGHGPTNGGTAVPADVMASIEEKLAASTFGKTLQDYSIGDLKLTMWIPDDLGKNDDNCSSVGRQHGALTSIDLLTSG
jgi:hypothetical protein